MNVQAREEPARSEPGVTPQPAASSQRLNARDGAPTGFPAIDKYELLAEIGHGGMATVYRARDPRLGREVAVKVIHKHLRENAEVAARFLAEARAAAKLRHPGIVEVYDVSTEEDGERYLVVELLRGCTLRKILTRHRDLPAEVGAAIVLELCGALEHAHASGIIHRDVKPENVLVELPTDRPSPSERHAGASDAGVIIKLTDFGIAKILDSQGLTSTGQVLGSPAHMAPEQIEGGEVDARTDVFALGVLMYECLVGHLPFEGKNPAQVLRRVLEGSYPPADQERPSVGGRWSRVVARALAREPAERPSGPAALAELIRAELAELGVTDPRAEITTYFAEPEGYAAELPRRLVPRLCARAEAARKRGDVPGAAADLNRALALAPDDLAILKKVSSLTQSASRRQLMRRAALVLASSAALGVIAFGVSRQLGARQAPPALAQPLPVSSPSVEARPVPSGEHAAVDPPPSASASAGPPRAVRIPRFPMIPSTPPDVTPVTERSGPRDVQFSIIPSGAKLLLDGQDVRWFGRTVSLEPGPHSVQVSVPNSRCCKAHSGSVTVTPAPAAGGSTGPQVIVLKLELLPATVSLAGAPSNAQYTCAAIGLSGFAGGGPKTVTLPDVTWSGECLFTPPTQDATPRSIRVMLRAGETNTISWPAN